MKKLALLMSLCATLSAGETIHPGSKVYVKPTKDDFDRYLMAEIQKEGLPIVFVPKREEAEIEIALASSTSKTEVPQLSVLADTEGNDDESMSVINLKTGGIIFSDTIHDRRAKQGYKSMAEICAKRLRKYMKKH